MGRYVGSDDQNPSFPLFSQSRKTNKQTNKQARGEHSQREISNNTLRANFYYSTAETENNLVAFV